MNKLYGLLMAGVSMDAQPAYYVKRFYPVAHTPKSRAMRDALMTDVPEDRVALLASFLCSEVKNTRFGEEILLLDSENTYAPFTRDPSRPADDPKLLIYDLVKPLPMLQELCKWLDDDLEERLELAGWLDVMAAVCLQILRETA